MCGREELKEKASGFPEASHSISSEQLCALTRILPEDTVPADYYCWCGKLRVSSSS